MKSALLILCLFFTSLFVSAQSYNPYVNQGIISPAPLLPLEFNGSGELSFNVGNTGSSSLPLVSNQEMTLIITLSNGMPDNEDPLVVMGGTWLSYFDWTYNKGISTYRGIQNKEIPKSTSGNITISYKVTKNTLLSRASNGFNVNLQPPPYANGIQSTGDDAVSSFTYVLAKDYGDAPISYGEASHDINIYKTGGLYTQYIHLGSYVDPEAEYQESVLADGDDNDLDDEDGVMFPLLIQGATVDIPVEIKINDSGFGFLNAWVDWNGDGDFNELGEQIITDQFISVSGIINYSVTVPEDAIITEPTFARFRIGNHSDSIGTNEWGEVEDYQITIIRITNLLVEMSVTNNEDKDNSGTITLNDVLTYVVTLTNTSTESLTNVVVDSLIISLNEETTPCINLTSETSCTLIGTYLVTQDDVDAGQIINISTGNSDETKPVEVRLITTIK
tara:strand:+ start:3192 stop:4532 length:1341 start_codon:yes stop_codon:yes gene_type:complete